MKNSLHEIQKLISKAESSSSETPQSQQILAQIEATLLRHEIQKVKDKSQKK